MQELGNPELTYEGHVWKVKINGETPSMRSRW
jgi:hypothetical protein